MTEIKGVQVYIKRDDLIHDEVSGNKWRKLKYHYEAFRESGKTTMLTFGGAFSNHVAATAALGKMFDFPTKALIRGEEISSNATLDFARSCGMEIHNLSRKEYDKRDNPEFLRMLAEVLPEVYLIPEGGKGILGAKGCKDILKEVDEHFDYVCCAGGTGTTMAGLFGSGYTSEFLLFPALRGGGFLLKEVERYLMSPELKPGPSATLKVVDEYHFGGYGKVKPALIEFMNEFYDKYKILLDPVYTAKMTFGIWDMIESERVEEGSRVLLIHTGGLQGIKGMNKRLEKSGLKIEV